MGSAKKLHPFEAAMAVAIEAERAAQRIPVGEFAGRSGVPVRTMQRYLHGERTIPLGLIVEMAKTLGVSAEYLFEEARKREAKQGRLDAE
jgi:transcriptional regulator with XRE-family HTH domain